MHKSSVLHPTVTQWYAHPTLQVLASSESLDWKTVSLLIERHAAIPDSLSTPVWEDVTFGLALEGSSRVHVRLINGISVDTYIGRQSLFLIPPHSEMEVRSDSVVTHAILRLNPQFVTETAAAVQYGDPTRAELRATFYFNDPLLYYLGAELANETRNGNPLGTLYADSLTNTLTLYLLRHYSTGQVMRDLSSSRLTPAQLSLIDEYVHSHLDKKISLADLAACLHLSVPHFERMFRITTNCPPYHYVLEIRLKQAKVMLVNSQLSIAEVAHQCGFSSQSHFTAHFTRQFKIPPALFARTARE